MICLRQSYRVLGRLLEVGEDWTVQCDGCHMHGPESCDMPHAKQAWGDSGGNFDCRSGPEMHYCKDCKELYP